MYCVGCKYNITQLTVSTVEYNVPIELRHDSFPDKYLYKNSSFVAAADVVVLILPILTYSYLHIVGVQDYLCDWSQCHTHTHTHSVGLFRTKDQPVTETSDNRQHSKETHTHINTHIHTPGGIRTRSPNTQAAADPRLRPSDHRDQP
jgi:hypothetical protein